MNWKIEDLDQATLEYLAQTHKNEQRGAVSVKQAKAELKRRKLN